MKNNLIMILLICFVHLTYASEIKVMTYNIRYNNPGDGENAWPLRKEKVKEILQKADCDIYCFQEALHGQVKDLAAILPGYDAYGKGRDNGKKAGEYSVIFVRKNRFKILEQDQFWLSPTPEKPGSKGWDAAITRICTWIKLRDNVTGKDCLLFNTHFDHRGKMARLESAKLVLKRADSLGGKIPFILAGDLNTKPETDVYRTLQSTMEDCAQNKKALPFTCCGFSVVSTECSRIDYILVRGVKGTADYEVINTNDGKNYPSDHLPVCVKIVL
jgi:endonuclease/exonuclease/phosphatase family metal-dependent hydrolase